MIYELRLNSAVKPSEPATEFSYGYSSIQIFCIIFGSNGMFYVLIISCPFLSVSKFIILSLYKML